MGKLFYRGSEGAKKGNREEKIRSGEAFQSGRKNEREEEKMRSGEAF